MENFAVAEFRERVIEMANLDHLAVLRQGVKAWNKWRKDKPFTRIDLVEADLSRRSLCNINFAETDLTRVNLQGTNLRKANLREADLRMTSLKDTRLEGADLAKAKLSELSLYGTDLSKINLCGADFRNEYFDEFNFTEANLAGADFSGSALKKANFSKASLNGAIFSDANLRKTNFSGADLRGVNFSKLNLTEINFTNANLERANFKWAKIISTDFSGASLVEADFESADLLEAKLAKINLSKSVFNKARLLFVDFCGANLHKAYFNNADLSSANLRNSILREANLSKADLTEADMSDADLSNANLTGAVLIKTIIDNVKISESLVYAINVWDLKGEFKEQKDLIITPENASVITVDNVKVAQFIYLILNNTQIRDVINTLTSKSVLILGRFAVAERKAILDALRNRLREYNLLPIVFDFERPTSKDFTETIKTLAGLSYFVIADVTNPKSAPLELQATVPDYQIPFAPIIQEGEQPFALMVDLQKKYNWVLDTLEYDSIDTLINTLKPAIIDPAIEKHNELRLIKAREPRIRSAKDFLEK